MAVKQAEDKNASVASEKQKALDAALAQIEKQFGKGAVMRLGQHSTLNVEAIPTGSLSLDIALGIGGVPKGRIIEIYGPESSGKTTVALQMCIRVFMGQFIPFIICRVRRGSPGWRSGRAALPADGILRLPAGAAGARCHPSRSTSAPGHRAGR